MLEKNIETQLRDRVKAAGGKAYKFVSPGNDGVPDRIVIMPGGKIYFVELKAPGKKPTALQTKQMDRLEALGCDVYVIASLDGIDGFMELIANDF